MCFSCWDEAGRPAIDNPAVRMVAKAANGVYEYSGTGGRLHILLDDWNADDEQIDWLGQYLDKYPARSAEEDKAERFCLAAFKPLSEDERISALALREEFWGEQAMQEEIE